MKSISLFLFLVIVFVAVSSWIVAGKLVAPAQEKVSLPETTLSVISFNLDSQSGENLSGWHLIHKEMKGVIVLFHGVRATKASMFSRAKLLYESGYSVVLIDFQSHGESTGNKITMGYLEKYDVLAAIDYAKSRHLGEPIGVIGVSLGGASTILASPKDINALIIESVYSDIKTAIHNRVKIRLGFASWFPSEILLAQLKPRLGFSASELSPIEKIESINVPIFIISGNADMHTTSEETKRMFLKANEPKKLWLVEGIEHRDIYSAKPLEYERKVIGFLNSNMKK